jgi:hypothetical protein
MRSLAPPPLTPHHPPHTQLYNTPPHPTPTLTSTPTTPYPKAIEAAAVLYDDYCRVITPENLLTEESEEVCAMLLQCMELRKKWLFTSATNPEQRKVVSLRKPEPFAAAGHG